MPRAPQCPRTGPRPLRHQVLAWSTTLALTVGLVLTAPPAEAMVTQTSSCVDGGGIRWSARAVWGDVYRGADGSVRAAIDEVGWTTSRAGTVRTDSALSSYDGTGRREASSSWTEAVDYRLGKSYAVRNPRNPLTAPGRSRVTVSLGLDGDGFGSCTMTFTQPAAATAPSPTIQNLPGQPALTAYGSSSAAIPYAKEGALVIAGRDQYDEAPFKNAAAAGATVLIYFDAVIDNPYGRYHELLNKRSECGPATARWPGSPKANQWGYLNDFRVGSAVQAKTRCVLEKMIAENPHLGGIFADDLGSRSWFPGFNWSTWGSTNQQAYRAGAIALAQTIHDVAVEHGLMVMVNGTWTAGTLASNGGGYPTMGVDGLSLADGGYIEHHTTSEVSYWTAYARGRWGTAPGSVSQGKPFMYVQANTDAERNAYSKAGAFSHLSTQRSYDTATVWGPFHRTGLPTRVAR